MFKLRHFLVALCVLMVTAIALADTIVLKDGTTIEGTVIKFGNTYRVKLPDGQTRIVPEAEVKQVIKGGSSSAAPAATPPPVPTPSPGAAKGAATGGAFATAKAKADRVEIPLAAVGIWQAFIDKHPNSADLEAGKAELERWKQLNKDGAEKINGKWISGEERTKLLKRVEDLVNDAIRAEESNTLAAIKKYEEAVKLYPNSFEAHFRLGYFYLVKGGNKKYDQAIKSLEQAVRVLPNSPEALTNLAIAYSFRDRHEQAVLTAYRAVKVEDSKELVENLLACFNVAPRAMQYNNNKVRPVMEEAKVLANKYGISGAPGSFHYLPPGYAKQKRGGGDEGGGDDNQGPPGVAGNGTGFFITADGYIMTNEHVAKPGDYLMVRLSDGTEKLAKRVCIDDEQDIAILKIVVDKPMPFIPLAPYDAPKIGADVAVLGFPLLSMFGLNSSLKITRGIVTAYDANQPQADVTVDAQVNPGNSGGPMVDKHGNLLALVAFKTRSDEKISSYGLGLSTGRLRKFFAKQQASYFPELKLEPGTIEVPALSTEELADKLTPATVCILIMRGEDPGSNDIDKTAPAEAPAPGGSATPGKKGAAGAAP